MRSFFKNSASKKAIIDLYYYQLKRLNLDYEFLTVETSFGDTNIIVTGNANNPPLVLVHGENSCAPLAIEKFKALESKFQIYAIDILGHPNLSNEVRLPTKTGDYGKWVYEILSRLQIHNGYLVGFSFGGYICLKTLIYDESRIVKVFLINPAGIIKSNPFKVFINGILPLKLFKIRKKEKYLQQYIKRSTTSKDNFTDTFLLKLIHGYHKNSIFMPKIANTKLQTITTPLDIVSSKHDYLFPGIQLLIQAKQWLPSLSNVVLLQNAKHIPNQENNKRINELILQSLTISKK